MVTKVHKSGLGGNTDPQTKRYRRWCFTSYIDDYVTYNDELMSYMIVGNETCPTTGRQHQQGFVIFRQPTSRKACQIAIGDKVAHCEHAKGSVDSNVAYCSKEEDFWEEGERPKQGQRNDLIAIAEEVRNGNVTVDQLALTKPNIVHQYGRTLDRIEDIRLRTVFRNFMTKGIWYYGATGTGKTERAFENYSPETHYVLQDDRGWWDGYTGQEIVIINDYRGWIRYDRLLDLVDRYPTTVPRRGRQPMPFVSKTVIITSALSPEECYKNRMENDSIEQLLRRFEVFRCVNRTVMFPDNIVRDDTNIRCYSKVNNKKIAFFD